MSVIYEVPQSQIDAWMYRVLSSVRTVQPGDAERIARQCALAEWCGDKYVSVWHETAAYYGTTCHCRRCETGG